METKIIWKCKLCNSIQESSSSISHMMDVCKCKQSTMDLEEGYSRSSGDIEIIKISEDGKELSEYIVDTKVEITKTKIVKMLVRATSEEDAVDRVADGLGNRISEHDERLKYENQIDEDEWIAKKR